jgi:hypothetical protein
MRFTVTLSDKYASGEASQDNCESYLSFCESNDTLPWTSFRVMVAHLKAVMDQAFASAKYNQNHTLPLARI